MKSIYKSGAGKKKILELYDQQLARLEVPYKDLYVETSFGRTHLIETGTPEGEPLLVFHGGNATTAYNLLACDFLFRDFHIYAVDTIGHPGKSAETSFSAFHYDYGKWAGEVIDGLGYERMSLYWLTGKDKWMKKTMLPMAITPDNITDDIYQTAKLSIDHVKVKVAMPTNAAESRMLKCKAPTLVMAAEKDCMFPGPGVLKRAKKIIPDCRTYLIRGRGHMHFLTEKEKKMIVKFLNKP